MKASPSDGAFLLCCEVILMVPIQNGFCFLDDQYFIDFPDDNLMYPSASLQIRQKKSESRRSAQCAYIRQIRRLSSPDIDKIKAALIEQIANDDEGENT